MNRRSHRPIDTDLEDLERELATLTLRVAALRNRTQDYETSATSRAFVIGDRVRFKLRGSNNTEGVIVGITTHRVQIRQDTTSHIFLRAPHNVTLL